MLAKETIYGVAVELESTAKKMAAKLIFPKFSIVMKYSGTAHRMHVAFEGEAFGSTRMWEFVSKHDKLRKSSSKNTYYLNECSPAIFNSTVKYLCGISAPPKPVPPPAKPTFKLCVCGSRSITHKEWIYKILDNALSQKKDTHDIIIVSGGAGGPDTIAITYAKERGYKVEKYLPEWRKYGFSAGFRRNSTMVQVSDAVIAFYDGISKGTADTIGKTKQAQKPLRVLELRARR